MGVTLQPLVVSMGVSYEVNTPFLPGIEPEQPTYTYSTPLIPGGEPEEGTTRYSVSTPYIPGFPPEETTRYSISTPVIPGVELDSPPDPGGIDDLDETYPGKLRNRRADQLELLTVDDHQDETYLRTTVSLLTVDDHMDETYLPTRVSGPDHGLWHLDETYEPTSVIALGTIVDVTPVTFYPIRRKSDTWMTGSKVQTLGVLQNPGPDQTVTFPRLPYQPDQPGDVV